MFLLPTKVLLKIMYTWISVHSAVYNQANTFHLFLFLPPPLHLFLSVTLSYSLSPSFPLSVVTAVRRLGPPSAVVLAPVPLTTTSSVPVWQSASFSTTKRSTVSSTEEQQRRRTFFLKRTSTWRGVSLSRPTRIRRGRRYSAYLRQTNYLSRLVSLNAYMYMHDIVHVHVHACDSSSSIHM